jgi:PDZ domain-containing protein
VINNPWDLPQPGGVDPVRNFHPWLWIFGTILVVLLIAASFFLPIPIFYAYLPGPVRDVERLIEVTNARTYSSEGSLYLTTVSVDTQVTFFDMIQSLIDEDKTIVTREEVTAGQSLQDLRLQQRREIRESKRRAQEVVAGSLGIAEPHGDGARVLGTLSGFPARGRLKEDDLIVSIDGTKVETTCDVGRGVDSHEIGEKVTLVVRRNGEMQTIALSTAEDRNDPGSSFLGVIMDEVNYTFDPGFDVSFETGKIAGPSAGLMFALALYDRLTPDDLTDGRSIAGTGTIACDGIVGPIGGVEQKVAGAEARGAKVFLSPEDNAAAAHAVADDIEIVSVATFDDAVEYLEALE